MRIATVILILVALAIGVNATFAAQIGFSGRVADCSACHRPTAFDAPAEVFLDGLPDTWTPGESYDVHIRVEGGPQAIPETPQGGFELEVSAGRLSAGEGYDDLLRHPYPKITTYEPAGTLMRSWDVVWQAPDMDQRPEPTTFWLAAVSANGNHVIALNASDQGEQGDVTAVLQTDVPPALGLEAQWLAMPLATPAVELPRELTAKPGTQLRIEGTHQDGNASAVAVRVDDGDWATRPTDGDWRVVVAFAPGEHLVQVRSEGEGRVSPSLNFTLIGDDSASHVPEPVEREAPMPLVVLIIGLLVAARK